MFKRLWAVLHKKELFNVLSQFKKVLTYRRERKEFASYSELLTGGNVDNFANLWGNHEENIRFQMSFLLLKKLEEGGMSKDWELGFREGLTAMPTLWKQCYDEVLLKRKREIEEKNRMEKLRKHRSNLV